MARPVIAAVAILRLVAAAAAAPGDGCTSELTTLCVLRNVCIEQTAPGATTWTQYGVGDDAAHSHVQATTFQRYRNVTVAASATAFDAAAADARALFRGTSLFMYMYQMHLPHFMEEALATLPFFARPESFGLAAPPARQLFFLGHVSPPGYYKYDYHKALQSLYTNVSSEWDSGILAADAFNAGSWDAFWSKAALLGDVVRPAGAKMCFEAVALNDDGMWHHSVRDARFLRQQAARQWGLDYSRSDMCVLQRKGTRAIANLDELVAMLNARTGKCVRVFEMERRPPHAQAALMASCGVLVTPHGANEANMVFMPEDATLVELMPVAYDGAVDYFKKLAASCGIRGHHAVIPYERLHSGDGCLANFGSVAYLDCLKELGKCVWCYKQSNMTVAVEDLAGIAF